MAKPKKKKIISASTGEEIKAGEGKKKKVTQAAPVGNSIAYRVGAFALWAVALVLEFVAIFILGGKITWNFLPPLVLIIVALVMDLICVVIGNQLWKKANRINPASEKNKFMFWLWNNMGVIVAAVAFIPFVIFALTNKEVDSKTKKVALVVAIIALAISVVCGIEFDPYSAEQKEAAEQAILEEVYWSPHGTVYHTHEDCSSLNQTEELTRGTIEQANENNLIRLCSFCAKKDEITSVETAEEELDTDEASEE